MQVEFQSRINRNLFRQERFWNNRDMLDALVFKITIVCGIVGLFLPWGGL